MFFLLLDQTISFRNLFSISSIPPFTTLCFIVSILCICLPTYQFFVFVCLGVLPTSTLYDNYFGPVSSLKSCTIYVLNRQMLCRFNVLCMIISSLCVTYMISASMLVILYLLILFATFVSFLLTRSINVETWVGPL